MSKIKETIPDTGDFKDDGPEYEPLSPEETAKLNDFLARIAIAANGLTWEDFKNV